MPAMDNEYRLLSDLNMEPSIIKTIKGNLRGQALLPEDSGYEKARTIWNAMINHRPGLIIRCAGVSDVIEAVNFARTQKILVSVKGGGHNVSGNAVSEGGLMIDLSLMRSVYVDPSAKIARAEGGATWKDYDRETQVFGLASTGGAVSRTGVAGLTLGGGWGWLAGKHGLACDNLLSIDIVTWDGKVVTANANQNSDLFWGVRGGGGNFGIATSFEFAVHPVREVLAGTLFFKLDVAREVLVFYDNFTRTCPDELVSLIVFLNVDGEILIGITVCYCGDLKKGEEFLHPLKNFGDPVINTIQETSYIEFQQSVDHVFPEGYQNYWKSSFVRNLDIGAIDTILDFVSRTPTPESVVLIEQVGNGVRRVGVEEMAFNHRDARYSLLICGMSPKIDDKHIIYSWSQKFWKSMESFTESAVYMNYLGEFQDEGEDRIKSSYGANKYARLIKLKNKFDPSNMFCLNQNIKPHNS